MLKNFISKFNKRSGKSLKFKRIKSCLSKENENLDVFACRSLDSTNNEAKRLFLSGRSKEALVISEKQTAGRGRGSKSFFSPRSGIYMSLLLPFFKENCDLVTCAAAVGVAEASESKALICPKIKWVNDLLIENKKFCGILSERVSGNGENDGLIIGIGINLKLRNFPFELQNIAGALPLKAEKNAFICEITNRVRYWLAAPPEKIIEEYKKRSVMLGKEINYIVSGESKTAAVRDIDEKGRLIVIDAEGRESSLSSGEISVKGLY